MKKLILLSFAAIFIYFFSLFNPFTRTQNLESPVSNVSVSIYKVPLVCNAAPSIGCGSLSKPVLLELESNLKVAGAWLNRTGTEIAVEWKDKLGLDERSKITQSIFSKYNVKYEELSGEEYNQSLESFNSKKEWYKGSEVDRLSKEEADFIAQDLINRLSARVQINEEKTSKLRSDISSACKKIFLNDKLGNTDYENSVQMELIDKLKTYLSKEEIEALKEVSNFCKENKKCDDSKNSSEDCCKKKK